MNAIQRSLVWLLLAALLDVLAGARAVAAAAPLGTAFSYQGRLVDGGRLPSARYDVRFTLYPAATGGVPTGPGVTNQNVTVNEGIFTTTIDFGRNVFTGAEYWLELGVRAGSDSGPFTTLAPRQLLTPVPYALYAAQAGGVADGALTGAALSDGAVVRSLNGLRDDFRIIGRDGVTVETTGGSIVIGAALPDCSTYSNCYWNLRGNGNVVAGVNFLGTTAGELAPLEFRVNNNRSLLHTFTGANSSPNISGGYRGNLVTGTGGTIGGGGQLAGINRVQADWGTVGGGYSNIVSSYDQGLATIPAPVSSILGGVSNSILGGDSSTIGGGQANRVVGSGGRQVFHATISGGRGNAVLSDYFSSSYSTIGGGLSNLVSSANKATIGGGEGNRMLVEGHFSAIGGGVGNTVDGAYGTISGGRSNVVVGPGNPDYAAIAGGFENGVVAESHYSAIGGGHRNRVEGFANHSNVGGGGTNLIQEATFSTIGGGASNAISGDFAVVPGGRRNRAAGNDSLAAGRRAVAQHNGTFVWADDTDADFTSTSSKQFAVRADNGLMVQAGTRALDLRGGGTVRVEGAGVGTSTPAFIHRAIAANTGAHVTTLNHPHCNGDPNAILMVTANWNPGGGAGVYNAHPIGVYYTGAAWTIFNQDLANMPLNAAFNVLVIKP